MSKPNPRDQINKASWTLMEGIKDAVTTNITTAARQVQLDIKGDVLARLLMIVNASVEEGYHRGSRVFTKAIENALRDAAMPPLEASPKKKSTG